MNKIKSAVIAACTLAATFVGASAHAATTVVTGDAVTITVATTDDGNCNFEQQSNKFCLPAAEDLLVGTTVKINKITIAQAPDNNDNVQKIKFTIDGTDYVSETVDKSQGNWSWVDGKSRVKRVYVFTDGPTVTVGTTYDSAVTWLNGSNDSVTPRFCATQDTGKFFIACHNQYTPASILEGTIVSAPAVYEGTISGDQIEWDVEPPIGGNPQGVVKLTVDGENTWTIDEQTVFASISLIGDETAKLTIEGSELLSIDSSVLDGFTGSVVYNFDATNEFEADATLLGRIKAAVSKEKFVFNGDGEYGATLNFGTSVKTLHTHIVFNGGKHSMTWQSGNSLFAADATNDNPTLLIEGETTLDFNAKDISGWSGGVDVGGVIRVKDGGTLNLIQIGTNTMFYRQRLCIDPGALVTFNCQQTHYQSGDESDFRWQGGAEQGKEQIYVPASDEDATDKPAIIRQLGEGGFHLASDATRSCAMFVGKNSKLIFDCDFTESSGNNAALTKYGEGEFEMAAERTITADFNALEGIVSLVNEPAFRNFTASNGVTYRFAETVEENEGVALCGTEGLLIAPEKIVGAVVYVGGDELPGMTLTYDDTAKTVAYSSALGEIDISGPSAGISDINAAYDESYGTELILNIDSPSGEMELLIDAELDSRITKLYVVYKGDIVIKPVEGVTIADYNALLEKFDFTQVEGDVYDKRNEYEAAEGADVRTSELNVYMRGYEFPVEVILHGGNIIWDVELVCGSMFVKSESNDKVVVSADGYPATAETALATDVSQVVGEVEWQVPTEGVDSKVGGNTYTRGAGTEAEPATFTINVANGVMTLKGGDYYFNSGFNGVQTTVNVIGAKVHDGAEAGLGIGQADYVFSGAAEWTAAKLILSQGAAGRTASLTLNDTSKMIVTGGSEATIVDSNQSTIMFGHWNGPSTFTLNGEAEFLAENAQVLVGKTSNNQTININGGTFTAKGIKVSAGAGGVNTLNIAGGELKLGELGITSYAGTTIAVNVTGNATLTPTAETLPITQPISGEGTLTEGDSTGVIDLTAQVLPLSVKLGGGTFKVNASTDSDRWFKVANLPGDEIPEELTILDVEGTDITDQLCAYNGGLYFGEIAESSEYTFSPEELETITTMDAGCIYSFTTKYINLTSFTNTPAGYLAKNEAGLVYVAKKTDSISIKFSPASINEGYISPMDEKVGGYPVAGLFWNHSKFYTGTQAGTTEIFALKDGNGEALDGVLCYYYMPNMYDVNARNVDGRNKQTTGNGKLTYSYLDDSARITPTEWPYSVGTREGVDYVLPKTPVKNEASANLRWEVAITNIPYQVFDLYIYQASDQTAATISLKSIAVKANDGEWKFFAGDGKGATEPAAYDTTWNGASYCDSETMVEGTNYIRYRMSKAALGLAEDEKIEVVYLSHSSREVAGRLGLAGVQIVAVENDGYYTRNSEATSTDWMVEDGWLNSSGLPTTWVNPEEGDLAYATINADVTPVITVDDTVVASSVTISNTAPAEGEDEKSFTFDGEGQLTAMIDATKFHGEIVLDADIRGSLTLGDEAYVVIDVPEGETKSLVGLTINGGEVRVTGAGTLVCDGFVPNFVGLQVETWTGTLYLKNALWTDWSFGSKGHIGSKIKVTGISGYAPNSTGDGANPELILEDENDTKALLVTNGYGGKDYFFNKVSGSGTFGWDPAATTGPQNGHTYIFKDITDFDGVFDAGAYLKIIVGDTTTTAGRGSITYKDGITVKPNLGWTAQSVLFGNTLDLAEGATVGDVVVTVANAPEALPVLTIGGEATELILVYEEGAVKIAEPAKTAGTMLFLR